mmetsp:Transcript_13818/g.18500  ORF Transcript_13818/g.18500 Transcript_13818/m.18500 type:complete len:115 (-) Transcript_13818:228-572(-)
MKFKTRKINTSLQSPDFITGEDRSRLRGGDNTRAQLDKNASNYLAAGFDCIMTDDYETSQHNFEQALRARLTLYGGNHHKVIEVHEAMGHLAVMRGDTEKADYHFNIVKARKGS